MTAAAYLYLAGALLLGIGFLACVVRFSYRRSLTRARVVLRASLIYLPGLLTLLVMDRIVHG
jgi:protoheme IX farnesyltransferase